MAQWKWNPELEAAIRDDPADDGRWSVLEDWLLEQADERAELVLLQKRGDDHGARRLLWAIGADLLDNAALAVSVLGASTWRAGYLQRLYFEAPPSTRQRQLAHLLSSRAAALMTALQLTISEPAELAALPAMLAASRCKHTLRSLSVSAFWKPAAQQATFDAGALASLALDELRFSDRAIRLAYAPSLARLTRLQIVPGAVADVAELFAIDAFPQLRHLDLYLDILEFRGGDPLPALSRVFEREAAPRLETLNVRGASPELFGNILDRLADSPLGPTLKVLERNHAPVAADLLSGRHLRVLGNLV